MSHLQDLAMVLLQLEEGAIYLWGGCVSQDFSESSRRKLESTIEIFDPHLETWEEHPATGVATTSWIVCRSLHLTVGFIVLVWWI